MRLVLMLAGIALALPLCVELSRSPGSIALLFTALATLTLPTALRLGLWESVPI